MNISPSVVIVPGFADPGVLGKMFSNEFGEDRVVSISVPGHPKTSPRNPKYWVRAIGDKTHRVLKQKKPELVVTNSIHTIETLSQIKSLEEAGDLKETRIAAFSPAFDIPQAVRNMYNLRCNKGAPKTKDDILLGNEGEYEELIKLIVGGKGNPEKFREDLNYYNENPELFFELVDHFGERIKILLNPNDRIIFSSEKSELDDRIKGLSLINIRGRDNGKKGKIADFMSHIQHKDTEERLPMLRDWIS